MNSKRNGYFSKFLRCPVCQGELDWLDGFLNCSSCDIRFPVDNGIHFMLGGDYSNEHQDFVEEYALRKKSRAKDIVQISGYNKSIFNMFRRIVHPFMPGTESLNILDAGSGSGHFSESFMHCNHVACVDYSLNMLSTARDIGHETYLANIGSMPFADNTFNRIFCIEVVSRIDRNILPGILKEFNRVLDKNGILFISCANKFSMLRRAYRAVCRQSLLKRDSQLQNLYQAEEIKGLLEHAMLSVENTFYIYYPLSFYSECCRPLLASNFIVVAQKKS